MIRKLILFFTDKHCPARVGVRILYIAILRGREKAFSTWNPKQNSSNRNNFAYMDLISVGWANMDSVRGSKSRLLFIIVCYTLQVLRSNTIKKIKDQRSIQAVHTT